MELTSSSSLSAHGGSSSVTTDHELVKPAPTQQQQNVVVDDPSIIARRSNLLGTSTRKPKLRPLTAAVLDLHLLDEHLLKGFLAPTLEQTLCSLVAVSNNNNNYNPTLDQWIRTWTLPLLGTLTLLWSNGQLPTTRMLGLAMVVHRRCSMGSNRNRTESSSSSSVSIRTERMRLLAYAVLRYGLPALYQTLRQVLHQRERRLDAGDRPPSPTTMPPATTRRTGEGSSPHDENIPDDGYDKRRQRQQQQQQQQQLVALQRQCAVLKLVLQGVDRVLPCLRLACLVQCWAGWSTTPDPAMVLTGWEYANLNSTSDSTSNSSSSSTSSNPPCLFHTQYAHRRWLWEQAWETLPVCLAGAALVRSTWSPWIEANVIRPVAYVGRRLESAVSSAYHHYHQRHCNNNNNTTCPLCRCRLDAAAILVQAKPCGHVYCYVCLCRASTTTTNTTTTAPDATQSNKFSCHVCGTVVTSASPI